MHGYGERSALLEEGDVGLDKVVNVPVQLGSRIESGQEVLEDAMSPSIKHLLSYLQQRTEGSQQSNTALRTSSHLALHCYNVKT